MKRYEDLDHSLQSMKDNVSWSAERQAKNRRTLASNLVQANAGQSYRKNKRKGINYLPITAFLLLLGIFSTLLFNIINGDNQLGEESTPPAKTTEEKTTDLPDKDNKESTNTGDTPTQKLSDMFEKEKDVEIELEGMKEPIHIELATNEDLRYIIYVERDRYTFTQGEKSDKIELTEPLDARYPEVAMEIRKADVSTVEEAIEIVEKEIVEEGMQLEYSEETTNPLKATMFLAWEKVPEGSYHQSDSALHEYYVTKDQLGRIFIIKQMYFLEGAEGHGVRFDFMLESFEVVPE